MANRGRVWDNGWQDCEVGETNGNLTYVEKADGSSDWVSPSEYEKDDS